jgi:hypothetical protein
VTPHVIRDKTHNHLCQLISQSVSVVFHPKSTLYYTWQERLESDFFSLDLCQEHIFLSTCILNLAVCLSVCIQELRAFEQIFVTFDTEEFKKNAHTIHMTSDCNAVARVCCIHKLRIQTSWNVMLCHSVSVSWYSEGTCSFHLQGFRSSGGMQNAGNKWRYSICMFCWSR